MIVPWQYFTFFLMQKMQIPARLTKVISCCFVRTFFLLLLLVVFYHFRCSLLFVEIYEIWPEVNLILLSVQAFLALQVCGIKMLELSFVWKNPLDSWLKHCVMGHKFSNRMELWSTNEALWFSELEEFFSLTRTQLLAYMPIH